MCQKLSNTAGSSLLEKELGRFFKYPYLHRKQVLINGSEETTIPIITMEEKQYIVPAIWGILPEEYSEDWHIFQNVLSSLSVNFDSLDNASWFAKALLSRRCLIPVTGYFVSFLVHGVLYPYYFHLRSGLPFCLAGIYNRVEDGFLTCSIITAYSDFNLENMQVPDRAMPVLLSKRLHDNWLNAALKEDDINDLLKILPDFQLIAHPISKEFFNNNISYRSILEPVDYDAVPEQIVLEQGFHILPY